MDDYYLDSSTNKKRLLVPVILLMLCAVSLTGAAYAYSQTFVGLDENPIDGFNYSIDYTNNNGEPITAKSVLDANKDDLSVYTEIVVGKSFNAFTNKGSFTRTMYVTVFTDSDKTFDLNAHVTPDSVLSTFITVEDVAINNVEGNTTTQITLTFNVANKNLNDMGLTNEIVKDNRASFNAAYEELLTHKFNVTVTAEPN